MKESLEKIKLHLDTLIAEQNCASHDYECNMVRREIIAIRLSIESLFAYLSYLETLTNE